MIFCWSFLVSAFLLLLLPSLLYSTLVFCFFGEGEFIKVFYITVFASKNFLENYSWVYISELFYVDKHISYQYLFFLLIVSRSGDHKLNGNIGTKCVKRVPSNYICQSYYHLFSLWDRTWEILYIAKTDVSWDIFQ